MQTKQVCQLDVAGYFIGSATAYESPRDPGVFPLPGGCIDAPVPDLPEGQRAKWVDGAWVFEDIPVVPEPPEPTLDQLKAAAWERIKTERDRRTDQGGFKVGTKWFHSDQKSRGQQLGLVLLGANIPAGVQWKTMDGTFVPMTQILAGQILAAGAALDSAVFANAETHRVAMEASADPAAYDFSGGWPAMFSA